MKPTLLSLACLLLGSTLGCSSSDSDHQSAYGSVLLSDYCSRYAELTCNAASQCGCLEPPITASACITFQRSECQDDVEKPVNEGRRLYIPTAAGTCLDRVRALISDCSLENDEYPAECELMLTAAVSVGGACDSDDDCINSECVDDKCTVMPTEGQSCQSSRCAEDHFCGSDSLCHLERPAGGSCADGAKACQDDLYCDSRNNTCQPYLGAGESCAHSGASCGDDLHCNSSSICAPYPGAGQPCDAHSCADHVFCNDQGMCEAERPDGSACAGSSECQSGTCTDKVCQPGKSDIC